MIEGKYMNPDTLPFALLLLLSEFTIGCFLVLAFLEVRGVVPLGYIKTSSITIVSTAVLTVALAYAVPIVSDVAGYPLDEAWFAPSRVALMIVALASVGHIAASYLASQPVRRGIAIAGGLAGIVALAALAEVVQEPTWGYAGTFLSLLAGGLSLGTVSLGMLLGHWYLVNPKLPEQPLNELVLGMIIIMVVQVAIVAVNVVVPAREIPLSDSGFDLGISSNPAFWLRVGVGLVFPILLGFMAWQSSRLRGMMSATGLLYIAMGSVLAGQALARGLLFVTGSAV
jgi:hypothetical protein